MTHNEIRLKGYLEAINDMVRLLDTQMVSPVPVPKIKEELEKMQDAALRRWVFGGDKIMKVVPRVFGRTETRVRAKVSFGPSHAIYLYDADNFEEVRLLAQAWHGGKCDRFAPANITDVRLISYSIVHFTWLGRLVYGLDVAYRGLEETK